MRCETADCIKTVFDCDSFCEAARVLFLQYRQPSLFANALPFELHLPVGASLAEELVECAAASAPSQPPLHLLQRDPAGHPWRSEASFLKCDDRSVMPDRGFQARPGVRRATATGQARAYALIGYKSDRDYRFLESDRALRQSRPEVLGDTSPSNSGASTHGSVVTRQSDLLTVNGEWTASVVIARCRPTLAGPLRWKVRFDTGLAPDITLVARMDRSNPDPMDDDLAPRVDMGAWPQRLGEENRGLIDSYRFETLSVLDELAARTPLKEAA